jgi:hypothetical protein
MEKIFNKLIFFILKKISFYVKKININTINIFFYRIYMDYYLKSISEDEFDNLFYETSLIFKKRN